MATEGQPPNAGEAKTQRKTQAKPSFLSRLTGTPRPHDEVLNDPNVVVGIWTLVGANILALRLLSEHDDPQVKAIGEVLADRLAWFYTDG